MRLDYLNIIIAGIDIWFLVSSIIVRIILKKIGVSGIAIKVVIVKASSPAVLLPIIYAI